jgi:hypothetical protein
MKKDARRPSQETRQYWLYAESLVHKFPADCPDSGKWLVFVHVTRVDEVWESIRSATMRGELGPEAKVSTMKPNPNATTLDKKVICVYTYDWADEADVRRVRQKLRELGITWKIPYKTDRDTLEDKYVTKRYSRISKYYE